MSDLAQFIALTYLLDRGEQHARHILLERREPELLGFCHLIAPLGQEGALIACSWRNQHEKEETIARVKATSHRLGAVAALIVHEAWLLKLPGELPPQLPKPSESPDRIEIVQLIATDGKRTLLRNLQIVRDKPGGAIISLIIEHNDTVDSISGLMIDNLIPPARR